MKPWKHHSYSSSSRSLPLSANSSTSSLPAAHFRDDSNTEQCVGTLIIIVLKAKNLHNRRAISKQNPFCSVRINKHHDRTETLVRGGQTPEWDHECRFNLTSEDLGSKLKVCVFDQDGNNTQIIGDVEVPIQPALKASIKEGYDSWQAIHYNKHYVGEVYLEMTYYPRKRPSVRKSDVSRLPTSSSAHSIGNLHGNQSSPSLISPYHSNQYPQSSRPLPKPPVAEDNSIAKASDDFYSNPYRSDPLNSKNNSNSNSVSNSLNNSVNNSVNHSLNNSLNNSQNNSQNYGHTRPHSLDPGYSHTQSPNHSIADPLNRQSYLSTTSLESLDLPELDNQEVLSREINIGYEESLFQRLKPSY